MPNICDVCGKPYEFALSVHYDPKTKTRSCRHDQGDIGGTNKLEAARRDNRRATMQAKQMASEARAEHERADPTVVLKNLTGERASREAQAGPMSVRTSLLKRLADKAKDAGYEGGEE